MTEGKKTNVILETIKNWFKKFGLILLGIGTAILAAITIKKIDHVVQKTDEDKKDRINENVDKIKENINNSSNINNEIKDDINGIKDNIEEYQQQNDKDKDDFVETQTDLVENAGFKKKQ